MCRALAKGIKIDVLEMAIQIGEEQSHERRLALKFRPVIPIRVALAMIPVF